MLSLSLLDLAQELAKLGPTSYFGERALLKNEPRAATVRAASGAPRLQVHVASALLSCLTLTHQHASHRHTRPTADVRLLALSQGDFTRILGPLHELLEKQATAYDTPTVKINKAS